jgi:cytochrome P450
VLCLLFAS